MDVSLSEDQQMLQDMTRRFIEDRAPIAATRAQIDSGAGFDHEAWREGAGLGWVALFVPEAHGGIAESALGVADAAIVAEELGRVVWTGPFVATCVTAFAIAQSCSDGQRAHWLPRLASGVALGAWCYAPPGLNGGADTGGVACRPDDDGFVLDGRAAYVEDAAIADVLLVTAQDGKGTSQFLVPRDAAGITVIPLETVDLGRRIADVTFAGVHVPPGAALGEAGSAGDAFERQLQVALVLQCAETVGVTDRVFEFTLEWVQDRFAFGRPIGSFQALKHRLAEHAANLEGAKAAAAHAARAVQAGAPDAAVAVSVAKSHCGRHATEIIRDCVQMHGGIGVTWDHDIHFYLRRAVSNEMLWGTPAAHHERLCRLAGL